MDYAAQTRFRIAIHRVNGAYFARALDIPGCISRGASEVEAVENVRATIRSFVRIARRLASDRPTVELEISA